jgi:glycine/sarcosine/betaine reductase complex component A
MDLESQKRIKDLTEQYGAENMLVVLGSSESESAGLSAETVSAGDPTYAGPLAGVSLGLRAYHICEAEIKDEIPSDLYEEQVGMMEMVMDIDSIAAEMKSIREQYCQFL